MPSQTEKDANDFDAGLYRLLNQARHLSEQGEPRHRATWAGVCNDLRAIRPVVRNMMDKKQRAETVGTY